MTQEEKGKQRFLICPKCGEDLDDDSYDEYTEYHNCIIGLCKKCGYNAHYSQFKVKYKRL